ncbi:transposase [Kitasatospora cineracea]|uniref:transposase n=1 Tax=Kitasatospora cineracea TaxID=88074 RepID=UPI0036B79E87
MRCCGIFCQEAPRPSCPPTGRPGFCGRSTRRGCGARPQGPRSRPRRRDPHAGPEARRVGRASRFPDSAAFANYAGAAPVEIASADKARYRLSRSGDRHLNSVLHTIAVVQIRMPSSPGHAYYQRKLAEGKTPKEAKRCLKRRLADHVRRVMLADERRVKSLLAAAA